jgi:hypothetical protein
MSKRAFLLTLFVVFSVIGIPVTCYAVFVNFDDVADETVISNTYASQGVTFTSSCLGCHAPPNDVFVLSSPIARSSSNVVSVFPNHYYGPNGSFDENFGGIITATFSCHPTSVSIWAIPDGQNQIAFLQAYNASDVMIDQYVSSGTSPELMTVNAPSGQSIAYVTFAGSGDNDVAFDDMTFTGGTCDSPAIPTMTEWGMIIFMVLAGLGAVYYLRKQRKVNN